jgi:hypothetical protein
VLVVDGGAELKCRIEVCVNEFLTKVQLKLPLRLAAALLIACAVFVLSTADSYVGTAARRSGDAEFRRLRPALVA